MTDGPLIVQSDKTVLLEVDHEQAGAARAAIAPFAELERAPEHIHTYRITPLALWNARAAGHDAEQVVDALVSFSRYAVPQPLLVDIVDTMARYGRLQLVKHPAHGLVPGQPRPRRARGGAAQQEDRPMLGARVDDDTVDRAPQRARPGQADAAQDRLAGRGPGRLRRRRGPPDQPRAGRLAACATTSEMAADSFWAGGSGVVVLPCGAGKTLVGAAAMAKAGATTLILVTNTVAGRQWKRELIARTSLTEDEIGEYSGERKEIRPVTIATYQVITRRTKGEYKHLELFDSRDWGLIIYDEVHLLPAPVFRMTADLQSRRRLGLTATLIREDGREGDVFSLIGPKRYDAPWKDIEAQGWIAPAECIEVRVTMTDNERMTYAVAEPEERYKLCSTAHSKIAVVKSILAAPSRRADLGDRRLSGPARRARHRTGRSGDPGFDEERRTRGASSTRSAAARSRTLVVSKVANFSIDLPEASVAVQVSGTFGSRQEEAQRLGRLLRPKHDGGGAVFYSVVSRDSLDAEYAAHRQRFLAEQGYGYVIKDADDLLGPAI